MKIELRNIKHSESLSEETNAFTANIYIEGKLAGRARNDGRGGMTFIEPRECWDRLAEYAKTLPEESATFNGVTHTWKPSADSIIDRLLTEHLITNDLKKLLSRKVLFTKTGMSGVFQVGKLKAADVPHILADPKLAEKLKAEKILNLLPFEEALAIYRTSVGG